MSTRCQIGIYADKDAKTHDFEALLYKHSDGYPEGENGIVANILPFLETFHKGRGLGDCEYLAARLIQFLTNKSDESLYEDNPIIGEPMNESTRNVYQFLGYGVSKEFHGDIDYFYKISPGLLEVFEVVYDYEGDNPTEFNCLEFHKIAKG